MADETGTETAPIEKESETIPMEQYKNLQRQLDTARKQGKEAALNRLDMDDLRADMKGLLESQARSADADDQAALEESTQGRAKARDARAKLQEITIDNSVDWSDPKLSEARAHYDAGEYDKAITAAEKAFEPEGGDTQALVDAAVQRAVRELGHVDQGGTQVTAGIPADADALREKIRDPAWFKEHRNEILSQARRGELAQ